MKKQIKNILLHVLNERKAHLKSTLSDIGYSFNLSDELDSFSIQDQKDIVLLLNEINNITQAINYLSKNPNKRKYVT